MRIPTAIIIFSLLLSACGDEETKRKHTYSEPVILLINGTVTYEDKEYDGGGFTGNTSLKAVRHAGVEVVSSAGGEVLASGWTDSEGKYSLSFTYYGGRVYLRALADTTGSGGPEVLVHDLFGALYATSSDNFIPSGGATVNLSTPVTSGAAGAFNILDVFTSGAVFVNSLSGAYPPPLTGRWSPGNTNGTYYTADRIYILGGDTFGDTDEYDDDVLYHELGHFIADNFSRDDSPGGPHDFTENDQDLRLSWSEGWGDFFPGALKTWLASTAPSLLSTSLPPSRYVDTINSGAGTFDFKAPGPGQMPYVYSSSEVAVAKVLLEAMGLYGMNRIWDVFASYVPSVTPANFEAFHDGWKARGYPDMDSPASILSDRLIYYKADSYELDDTPSVGRMATNGVAETHYIYNGSGSDIDIVAFDAAAGQLTASTDMLLNGVDTFLRLLGTDGSTQLADNDDTYNAAGYNYFSIWFASKIIYTIPAAGIYYIEVSASPTPDPSAGRYGTYTLRITQP